jgi:thymidylate synthase
MSQYENLIREVLEHGERSTDRTGTGTLSIFGHQSRYDMRAGFPLVTTKRVNFSAVVKELLWFLRGETNIKTLGCGIWDEWADERGDLGPIYGQQWRAYPGHFGSIDQIANAARMLVEEPDSRRNVVSAWTVCDLRFMRLQPCHAMFQLRRYGEWLDLQLYQRSADVALGVPFNIASYSLLLHMFAAYAGIKPRYFVHTLGDAHIYLNHIDGLTEQLRRVPRPLPTLKLLSVPNMALMPFKFDESQIVLEGYDPHKIIKFPIAV